MPMLAHFEELDTNGERRRVPRRALRLGVGSDGGSVTIHDLSLTGALLETSTAMLVGAMLEVELPTAGKIEAEVIWNSGEYYGCQFALPISPSALSAALLQSSPADREDAAEHDPVSELKELGAEIERLSLRMDSALQRLNKTR
ncbi:MAG: PilZ domain-containing protein [Sphingomicrobium sp.]